MRDAMDHAGGRSTRAMVIECVAVATIVFTAYAVSHPDAVPALGKLYDDVVYLSVGKSIADGHGYRSAQLVGTPVQAKFPPLLPAIYALGWRAFGSLNAVATFALWLNIFVTAAGAGALWWLARRELGVGPVLATLFVVVPVLTARTMFYFSGAASEPWMLLGWAIALLLVRRLTRIGRAGGAPTVTAIALGLTLAATSLSRTQGTTIAIAVLAGAALARVGWRPTVVAAATASTPLLVWAVWHRGMMARGPLSTLPDQSSYLAWIPLRNPGEFARFATAMMRTSLPVYWSNTADVLVGWTSPKTLLLASGLLVCGAIGIVLLARTAPALAASLAVTLAVLAIWPYVQDRFLTPVLPVLGVAGAFAVQRGVSRVPRLVQRVALGGAAAMAALILFENARVRWSSVRDRTISPFVHAIDEMVAWVDRRTAPTEHVMVSWGGTIYLRTGRLTSISDPEEPTIGSNVLAVPSRFYASRILDDSVDAAIIWDRAPGRSAAFLRALTATCTGVLTEVDPDTTAASTRNGVHFYRVRRDLACLRQLARSSVTPAENNNAP
jgi:hypothetical protein